MDIGYNHSALISRTHYVDDTGEFRTSSECDLQGMKEDQAFKNQFALSADLFDVYVRDGLEPWIREFNRTHEILDRLLGIEGHD